MTAWTKESKSSATLTKEGFTHLGAGFLLTEDGGYLLQEEGDRILLERDSAFEAEDKFLPTFNKTAKTTPDWTKEAQ